MSTINKRLRNIRKQLGLTQESFANGLNLKRDTIFCYESGKRQIPPHMLNSICKTYNVNEDYLIHGKGEILKPIKIEDSLISYNLDKESIKIIKAYINIPARDRIKFNEILSQLFQLLALDENK